MYSTVTLPAGLRCCVISQLGTTVEVPDEVLT